LNNPLYAQGHLAILRGNLATEGAVAKITGVKSLKSSVPPVFLNLRKLAGNYGTSDSSWDVIDPLRRSQGGPGMRKCWPHFCNYRCWLGRFCGTNYDGRFSGGTAWLSVTLRQRQRLEAIALVQEGDTITIDAAARLLHLHVSDAELERRRAAWQPRKPRYTTVLAKYAKLVSSSSIGAVTDLGCKSRLLF